MASSFCAKSKVSTNLATSTTRNPLQQAPQKMQKTNLLQNVRRFAKNSIYNSQVPGFHSQDSQYDYPIDCPTFQQKEIISKRTVELNMSDSRSAKTDVHELIRQVQVQHRAPTTLLRKAQKGDFAFSGGYRTENKSALGMK